MATVYVDFALFGGLDSWLLSSFRYAFDALHAGFVSVLVVVVNIVFDIVVVALLFL